MPARYTLSYLDYKGSVGTLSTWGTTLTSGNITAQVGAAQALRDAIAAVTMLNLQKETLLALETKYSVAKPTDANAQKGTAWLVRMNETGTGNNVSFTIPGALLTGLLVPGGNQMDLTNALAIALVSAIEGYSRSNDGNGVTVQEIVYLD